MKGLATGREPIMHARTEYITAHYVCGVVLHAWNDHRPGARHPRSAARENGKLSMFSRSSTVTSPITLTNTNIQSITMHTEHHATSEYARTAPLPLGTILSFQDPAIQATMAYLCSIETSVERLIPFNSLTVALPSSLSSVPLGNSLKACLHTVPTLSAYPHLPGFDSKMLYTPPLKPSPCSETVHLDVKSYAKSLESPHPNCTASFFTLQQHSAIAR
jgi:hypothetical protein